VRRIEALLREARRRIFQSSTNYFFLAVAALLAAALAAGALTAVAFAIALTGAFADAFAGAFTAVAFAGAFEGADFAGAAATLLPGFAALGLLLALVEVGVAFLPVVSFLTIKHSLLKRKHQ